MVLPEGDRDYLTDKGYKFEEKDYLNGVKGVVIKNLILPENKFTRPVADLLIILPPGYPDVPPDMFYFSPPLLLLPANRFARATEAMMTFGDNVQWQRWSRHLPPNNWRRQVDGIHTYLKRVEEALKRAS